MQASNDSCAALLSHLDPPSPVELACVWCNVQFVLEIIDKSVFPHKGHSRNETLTSIDSWWIQKVHYFATALILIQPILYPSTNTFFDRDIWPFFIQLTKCYIWRELGSGSMWYSLIIWKKIYKHDDFATSRPLSICYSLRKHQCVTNKLHATLKSVDLAYRNIKVAKDDGIFVFRTQDSSSQDIDRQVIHLFGPQENGHIGICISDISILYLSMNEPLDIMESVTSHECYGVWNQ